MDSKKISITGSELYEVTESLEVVTSAKMAIWLSHKLSRNLRELRVERKTLDESRNTMGDKYAKRDDDGNKIPGGANPTTGELSWKMDPSDQEPMAEEFKDLMDSKIELTIYPVKLGSFPKSTEIEGIHLEPLCRVGIIEEPDDEPKEE